jgi:hypothetical protein
VKYWLSWQRTDQLVLAALRRALSADHGLSTSLHICLIDYQESEHAGIQEIDFVL